MKTTYKLLSYSANKLPRAGVLVGDTVYDAQKATGVAAHANMLGILADWSAAKKARAGALPGANLLRGGQLHRPHARDGAGAQSA